MSLIYDHAPVPGPQHYSFRCTKCGKPVADHANAFTRMLWRKGKVCEHPPQNALCVHGDEINHAKGRRRWCASCGSYVDGPLPELCSYTGKPHDYTADHNTPLPPPPPPRVTVTPLRKPWIERLADWLFEPKQPAQGPHGNPVRATWIAPRTGGYAGMAPGSTPERPPAPPKGRGGASGPWSPEKPAAVSTGLRRAWVPSDFPDMSVTKFDKEEKEMSKKRTEPGDRSTSWFEVDAIGSNMEQVERNAWNAAKTFGGEGATIVEHARDTAEPHGQYAIEGGTGNTSYFSFRQKFTFTVQRRA